MEPRIQILNMHFGMRSLSYLLEEKKLQECGLVGENESTDDWLIPKFVKWESVHVPHRYMSPSERPPILGSPVRASERSRAEDEGILTRMLDMYSPTLLNTTPYKLGSFPKYPDHNFFIWANPDFIVHRFDEGLRSWQVKYSTEEHMDEPLDQYDTNDFEELSHIDVRVDDLPLAIFLAEHAPTIVLYHCLQGKILFLFHTHLS